MKYLSDRPALVIVLLTALYWLVFPLAPKPKGSDAIAIGAVCAGIFLVWQYSDTFFEILFKHERRLGWVAILCVTGVGVGMITSGIYRLLWNRYGQPQEWVSSATATFGLAILMVSAFGLGFSHTLTKVDGNYPRGFWHSLLVALAIILAFVAGQNYSPG